MVRWRTAEEICMSSYAGYEHRDWLNALSADVPANCVLAELSVDQGGELSSL
jgi:hypothetical protein